MQVETKELGITQGFIIEAVQDLIAQSAKTITEEMLKALMSNIHEPLNFKALAENYISPKHTEELNLSDEKIQLVYQKLFCATHEHIKQHSQPLVMTFAMMNDQTKNITSAGLFLGSFVLPAAKILLKKLEEEQPGALENKEIWK